MGSQLIINSKGMLPGYASIRDGLISKQKNPSKFKSQNDYGMDQTQRQNEMDMKVLQMIMDREKKSVIDVKAADKISQVDKRARTSHGFYPKGAAKEG